MILFLLLSLLSHTAFSRPPLTFCELSDRHFEAAVQLSLSGDQKSAHDAWKRCEPFVTSQRCKRLGLSLQGINSARLSDVSSALQQLANASSLYREDGRAVDATVAEYLGACFGFVARRAASSVTTSQTAMTRYEYALRSSSFWFMAALKNRVLSSEIEEDASLLREFAQPVVDVYRGLGDALNWLGEVDASRSVFQEATSLGIFPHPLCRPASFFGTLYHPIIGTAIATQSIAANGDGAPPASSGHREKHQPFIFSRKLFLYILEPLELLVLPLLQKELESAERDTLEGLYQPETGGLHNGRGWSYAPLVINSGGGGGGGAGGEGGRRGRRQLGQACSTVLRGTCDALLGIPEAARTAGQVKLSRLRLDRGSNEGGGMVHIKPHCGPTNARIRIHCGVRVPAQDASRMRVGDANVTWQEGVCFAWEESCEHEVWLIGGSAGSELETTDGALERIILIVDVPNPLLESFDTYSLQFADTGEDSPVSEFSLGLKETFDSIHALWKEDVDLEA